MAYSQYFAGLMTQLTPDACVVDLTPPTFAGVTTVTANTDGSFTVNWLAASDITPPITYAVYVALGSVNAAALFVSTNISRIAPAGSLSTRLFLLGNQSTYFVNGQLYTFGVRAIDGVGNVNTNTVITTQTAIASGNMPIVYQDIADELTAAAAAINSGVGGLLGTAGLRMSVEQTQFVMTFSCEE